MQAGVHLSHGGNIWQHLHMDTGFNTLSTKEKLEMTPQPKQVESVVHSQRCASFTPLCIKLTGLHLMMSAET